MGKEWLILRVLQAVEETRGSLRQETAVTILFTPSPYSAFFVMPPTM